MKPINFFKKKIFLFIFFIYFFIGISIVEDYGISIDEEFQRFSGFYWLCYVLEFLHFDSAKSENLIVYLNSEWQRYLGGVFGIWGSDKNSIRAGILF